MSTALIEQLIDSLVEQILAKLGPRLLAWLEEHRTAKQPDPLLTAKEAGERLGLSDNKVRELIACGHLIKAPGLIEVRIRQSVVDAFGTKPKSK